MRRQLNGLVLATTALVVVSFLVPLGLLVRRQAQDAAQVAAEQRAQSAAAALAVAVSSSDGRVTVGVAESALVTDVEFVLPNGGVVGDLEVVGDSAVAAALAGRTASEFLPSGDWVVALPVATPDGIVAVAAVAPAGELNAGVGVATGFLAALGLLLVGGSVVFADRLGRSVVRPVTHLAAVANRLAAGDLRARADGDGPPEVREVGVALNGLAGRLDGLIEGEREALADLSHRLRTPLTALRLEAERTVEGPRRAALLEHVERAQGAVDDLIREVRDRGKDPGPLPEVDLVSVVEERLAFWTVLARAQARPVSIDLPEGPVPIGVPASEIVAAIDAVLGNIFAHTERETGFAVNLHLDGSVPVLEVSDEGRGFGGHAPTERGQSGAGSTGLGLDIVRRLAEDLGGDLQTHEGPTGGALVRIRLGGPSV